MEMERIKLSHAVMTRKALPGMEQVYHHRRGGENVFMPDTDDRKIPGQIGLGLSVVLWNTYQLLQL